MSDPTARAERRARSPQGEGARLRDELIAAADRILARTGDEEGLSLRAVAREAGVAGPSVYLHFAGKDDLIRAVMRRHFDELRRAIEAAAAAAPGPAERLRAGCLAYCRFAVEQPGAYRVLFGNRTSGLAEPPDQGIGLDAFGTLVDGVRACMAAGAAPPGDPSGWRWRSGPPSTASSASATRPPPSPGCRSTRWSMTFYADWSGSRPAVEAMNARRGRRWA
jgi:AcrR family transcriptional regulator